MFGRKGVFPSQREDEEQRKDNWDQMQRMLGQVVGRLDALERSSRRQPVVARQPAVQEPQIRLHEPKVDLAGLPDPVTDKDAFMKEVGKRLQTQLDTFTATVKGREEDAGKAAARAAQTTAGVDKLWKRWQKEYKQFGKLGRIVQAEAAAMVQEGIQRGLAAEDVMFQDEDGFLEDLAERVSGAAEEMGIKVEDEARDPAEIAQEVDQGLAKFEKMFTGKDVADPELAAGDMGSLTPRKPKAGADKPEPLTSQLRKMQHEMGVD